ncbi:3-hydroxyacyl-CoA dehydrogenase family protein [Sediminibacterium sp. TEGAF015]|uniref:3-hydroxyacyl-CoA dehydrogenase family protein n=1 Tax=Sediminibacterium sp. TEGAF015 TaxID=575378 RepID=UPI0021FD0512|nr:3-hydroxyacyl-CoA dehydrogenase NAD-binding domain-containing protein [Sediminibacterium sp. TEGAF015]BDQ12970.1 hypothetical protein TEGAF0_21870 [Sediminibacterium sp. TEGAF015]
MEIRKIERIVVCGAGTMGSGIAQVAATAGYQVVQFDLNEAVLLAASQRIRKNLEKLQEKGKITQEEFQGILNKIQFTNQLTDCKGELIIEAIIEKKEAKINLFNQLITVNSPDTILASNTSSISIDAIASGIDIPAQLVGLHFFNPAPLMKLVEIIQGKETNPAIVQSMVSLVASMQKKPVICKDSPGFIVNRVARPYYLESMYLVQSGQANVEQTDKVLEAAGFKMGPFKLMDLIGLDINYSVSTIVWEDLGKPERLKPSIIQKEKIDLGQYGVKTKKGFYDYE